MHPNVLAQVDPTNAGNKQKFMSDKKADVLSTSQKWQRDVGRFKVIKHFDHTKEETLTWVEVLFHNGKVDSYGDNANVIEELCHCQQEHLSDLWGSSDVL